MKTVPSFRPVEVIGAALLQIAAATALVAQPPAPPSAAALEALDSIVTGYVDRNLAVGAELLVMQDGKVLLHRAHGLANRETERPWEVGTISNIRSMTKPITGAAVQLLVDRGLISLDDSVSRYLSGFDNDKSRGITLRQIVSHRSGLPLTIIEQRIDEYSSLQEQANAAGERGPQFPPDSKFWYSDIGTDVAAAVVEAASGRSWAEFVRTELLEPLGMKDSFFGTDPTDPRFGRIAVGYMSSGGAWNAFWSPDSGKALYPFAWGSQTIYSTPRDYARFLQLWLDHGRVGNQQLLSPEAVARQTTPVVEMSALGSDAPFPTSFSGLEVWYGQFAVIHVEKGHPDRVRVLGHSGSDGTIAWAWPDRRLMILYFTQSRGGTTAIRLEDEIDRLLINPDRVAEPVPEELAGYVGRYVANFGRFENEVFEVKVKDGRLVLDIPSALPFVLVWLEAEQRWAAELARDQLQVSFEPGEGGPASKLVFHQFGAAFDVPRVGSPAVDSLARDREVPEAELSDAVGRYGGPDSARVIEVFVRDGSLAIRAPNGVVVPLRPSREADRWHLREAPGIAIVFDRDADGRVVSFTRRMGTSAQVQTKLAPGGASG
ncbi:MAG: serine hydrolase domain-containing protein [Gemmatimonadales bacterium]